LDAEAPVVLSPGNVVSGRQVRTFQREPPRKSAVNRYFSISLYLFPEAAST
jgi:hypothetical protein